MADQTLVKKIPPIKLRDLGDNTFAIVVSVKA